MPECPPGVRAKEEGPTETRTRDEKGLGETCPHAPESPNSDESRPKHARPPRQACCHQCAPLRLLQEHAAIWLAWIEAYRRFHPGKLCRARLARISPCGVRLRQ